MVLLDYRHNPQGELYFIHNDHLGTPKLITNSAQEIVWRNTSSAFGQMQTAQINDNDHSAQTLEQNLSFPGQYRDTETGFSYNYFRDYDPSLGRYIQSDPIGLEGGVNTYGYVMGNPVGLVDPLGLCDSAQEKLDSDISKLRNKFKEVVKHMDDAGLRRAGRGGLNGSINNIIGFWQKVFGGDSCYMGCTKQTQYLYKEIVGSGFMDSLSLDWSVKFKYRSMNVVNFEGPHNWLEASPSTPGYDGSVTLDTWRNSFESNVRVNRE